MEKRNLFVSGKAVVAAVCGAFTAAYGWLGWLVVAWAACMALDWVSGSAAAASRGAWSSAAARAGIHKPAGPADFQNRVRITLGDRPHRDDLHPSRRAVHADSIRLAGLACCGVGRLHGAGLGQRQRRDRKSVV